MSATSHTPGPWVAVLDRHGGRICAEDEQGPVIVYVPPDYVDERNTDIVSEEGRANARLIAAAPDLLEVCRIVAETTVCPQEAFRAAPRCGCDCPVCDMARAALRALARAKGGA